MGKSNKIEFDEKVYTKIIEITEKYDIKFDDFINDAVKYYIKKEKYLKKSKNKKLKIDNINALNKFLSENFECGERYYIPKKVFHDMLCNAGLMSSDNKIFDEWIDSQKHFRYGYVEIDNKRTRVIRGIRLKNDPSFRRYHVGDKIILKLNKRQYTAIAVQDQNDGMLFMMKECFKDFYEMNLYELDGHGYQDSYLRVLINTKIFHMFPSNMLIDMLPVYDNNDFIRIPTEVEIMGRNVCGEDEDSKYEYFADADIDTAIHRPYWLMNTCYGDNTRFCVCENNNVYSMSQLDKCGVRLVFKLKKSYGLNNEKECFYNRNILFLINR